MKKIAKKLANLLHKVSLRRKIISAVVILLTIVGWYTVSQLLAPAHGQINNHPTIKKPKIVENTSPPVQPINNRYYKLLLPTGYSPVSNSSVPANLLYAQTIIKPTAGGSLVINIAITALEAGGLDQNTSYHLRQTQSARYLITSRNVGSDSVQIANDKQSASVVAFWPHANYLAIISASSGIDNPVTNDNSDEINALLPIFQGWQWQ